MIQAWVHNAAIAPLATGHVEASPPAGQPTASAPLQERNDPSLDRLVERDRLAQRYDVADTPRKQVRYPR